MEIKIENKLRNLGSFLMGLRKNKLFSYEKAAKEALICANNIHRWEHLKTAPTCYLLNDYLKQYGYELKICKIKK